MALFPSVAAGETNAQRAGPPSVDALSRQLATLVFAATAPHAGAGAIGSSVACFNALLRLGYELPLVVVYDLQRTLGGAVPVPGIELLREKADSTWDLGKFDIWKRYVELLRGLAASTAIESIARRPLTVEFEAVLIARLVRDPYRRWLESSSIIPTTRPLPLTCALSISLPSEHAAKHSPLWCLSFIGHAVAMRDLIEARSEQIDLGSLRLLGLLRANTTSNVLDLYNMMGSTQAGQSTAFSRQLLPPLLETQRSTASQRYSIDGYSSFERKGSPDAILPSELAQDEDTFAHRALNDELLFYGHERRSDSEPREHWILVDSSASMRGMREICARGLAISLSKKLSLRGDSVVFRFFDSRLHRRVSFSTAGSAELPYVFSFRSENGRHYARSFEDLLGEARRSKRKGARTLAITFLTHSECHIPTSLVESLAQVARIFAVFVLPSQTLSLGYLSHLHQHHIVSRADFANPDSRKRRSLEVIEDISLAHT
jgi:hypothetical protein